MQTRGHREGNLRGAEKQCEYAVATKHDVKHNYHSWYHTIVEIETWSILWVLKEWRVCNAAEPKRALAAHWNLCGGVTYQWCVSTGEKKAGSYLQFWSQGDWSRFYFCIMQNVGPLWSEAGIKNRHRLSLVLPGRMFNNAVYNGLFAIYFSFAEPNVTK